MSNRGSPSQSCCSRPTLNRICVPGAQRPGPGFRGAGSGEGPRRGKPPCWSEGIRAGEVRTEQRLPSALPVQIQGRTGDRDEAQGPTAGEGMPHLCHTHPIPRAPSLLALCPPTGPGALPRQSSGEAFHCWQASHGGPSSQTIPAQRGSRHRASG